MNVDLDKWRAIDYNERLKKELKILVDYLKRENELKSKRSEVKDLFKLGKCGLFMDKIHRLLRDL
ncbi:hypothetical protein [Archaeoglobus sulfaticallidus]|nr:hypothetical protein [Archaeoglobus sulfaticallidus]